MSTSIPEERVRISVRKLLREFPRANLFRTTIYDWGLKTPLRREDIAEALKSGGWTLGEKEWGTGASEDIYQCHVLRVAFLIKNPHPDPIELDVGIPSLGSWPSHPICDGNHRFAAALFLRRAWIWASVSGEVRYISALPFKPGKHYSLKR